MKPVDLRSVPPIGGRVEQEDYGFANLSGGELRELWDEERRFEGKRDRKDFARLTALRCELFSRLTTPASVKSWGKDRSS